MSERAQALEAAEPWREQLDRLRLMAENADGDWDLSDNDRAAIRAAMDRLAAPPVGVSPQPTNIIGDHECSRCSMACDCCQPSDCQVCSKCAEEIEAERRARATRGISSSTGRLLKRTSRPQAQSPARSQRGFHDGTDKRQAGHH